MTEKIIEVVDKNILARPRFLGFILFIVLFLFKIFSNVLKVEAEFGTGILIGVSICMMLIGRD